MARRYNERKENYRMLRSTVVLSLNSSTLADVRTEELERALTAVQEVNYDLAALDAEDLEVLYAVFDDKLTARVLKEFEFIPGEQNVIVHDRCEAICNLCGKGDSLATSDNEDQIRIEFRLSNGEGGNDVWCGLGCIKNYGLKVRGAKTAAQASKILDQAMRRAVRRWEIARWQGENPTHAQIPDQYQQLRRLIAFTEDAASRHFAECVLAGFDIDIVGGSLPRVVHEFQVAMRFYKREEYLTGKKAQSWEAAKASLSELTKLQALFARAEGKTPRARFAFFEKVGAQVNEAAA